MSLLALLAQRPCYGYQLRGELDWRTGGSGPVNVGQIYNTLDRLERDKLVRKTGENNYFAITDAGRAAVAAWFNAPSPRPELPTKLALAATLPGVDLVSIIQAQRAALSAETADPQPKRSAELARSIVATAASIETRSERELLDATERLVGLGIPPTPLSADIPKRGRPAKAAG